MTEKVTLHLCFIYPRISKSNSSHKYCKLHNLNNNDDDDDNVSNFFFAFDLQVLCLWYCNESYRTALSHALNEFVWNRRKVYAVVRYCKHIYSLCSYYYSASPWESHLSLSAQYCVPITGTVLGTWGALGLGWRNVSRAWAMENENFVLI